jgi:hypothetical protein
MVPVSQSNDQRALFTRTNARCTKCAIKSILQEPFRDRAPLWLSLEMSRILQWKQHHRALTEMN